MSEFDLEQAIWDVLDGLAEGDPERVHEAIRGYEQAFGIDRDQFVLTIQQQHVREDRGN